MDDAKTNELQQWLIKAHHDVRSVRQLLAATPPILDTAAFHCQQAAEKALKAYLVLHDVPFVKTHLLSHLVAQCADIHSGFHQFMDAAEILTPFATSFRYPGDVLEPAHEDVEVGLYQAEKIMVYVLSMMPDELVRHLPA